MKKQAVINKGKMYDRILTKMLRKMSTGSILLLNNDGLRIAEKSAGFDDSDGIWGSANSLIQAGERALRELHQEKHQFINQIFESDKYLLMTGPVSDSISYAILSSKLNKISLGMLKLFAENLKEQVNEIDAPM